MLMYRLVWIAIVLCVAGCHSEQATDVKSKTSEPPVAATAQTSVSLGLNWYPEAEHGGFYAALVHGYYAEEGLNVKIVPGGPGVPVIADAAEGKVDFAVDNADKLLLLRAQQADAVAVMAPIQNSPRCIMVHKKSGLNRLEDLSKAGSYTLAVNQGQPFAQFMIKKLSLGDIRVVPFPSGIAAFLSEPNYGQQAYSFSEPFLAEEQGSDPHCLMLSDIGFNTYTSTLITRREMIDKHSDTVARMTRASIRGWKKYLSEPNESNQKIHDENIQMSPEILAFGAKALRPLCLPEGFEESRFGEMTAERWQTLASQMIEIGSIKSDSGPVDNAFTLKFVQQP